MIIDKKLDSLLGMLLENRSPSQAAFLRHRFSDKNNKNAQNSRNKLAFQTYVVRKPNDKFHIMRTVANNQLKFFKHFVASIRPLGKNFR